MFLKLYFITLSIFLAIDMSWLGLMSKRFYSKQIGFLMKTNINWIATISFYLLFTIGLVIFVLIPSIEKKSWLNVLLLGSLFGLISYATYDLTNLATVKNWPVIVTLVDMVWGAVLGGLTSLISYLVFMKIR